MISLNLVLISRSVRSRSVGLSEESNSHWDGKQTGLMALFKQVLYRLDTLQSLRYSHYFPQVRPQLEGIQVTVKPSLDSQLYMKETN